MICNAHSRLWNLLWHPIWKQQRADAKEKGLPFPRGPPTSPAMVRLLEDETAGSAGACDPPSAPYIAGVHESEIVSCGPHLSSHPVSYIHDDGNTFKNLETLLMSSGSPQTTLHTTAADAVSGSTHIAQVVQAGDVASSYVRVFNSASYYDIAKDDDDTSSKTAVDGENVVSL